MAGPGCRCPLSGSNEKMPLPNMCNGIFLRNVYGKKQKGACIEWADLKIVLR